jgi:hypothetical protein
MPVSDKENNAEFPFTDKLVSVHKRASLPVMDSLRKNVVLLRSHFQ